MITFAERLQIICIFAFFIFAIVCSVLPLIIKPTLQIRYLPLANCLSSGFFLGAAVIHLLHEADDFFREAAEEGFSSYQQYPAISFTIALVGFLFMLIIEKWINHKLLRNCQADSISHFDLHGISSLEMSNKQNEHIQEDRPTRTYLPHILAILLSVHSLIEGMALGIQSVVADILVTIIAIGAHKGFEAATLGISFVQQKIGAIHAIKTIVLYSLMTPVGIALGLSLSTSLTSKTATVTRGVLGSFASGLFIYIATMDIMAEEFAKPDRIWQKCAMVFIGVFVMGIVAIWG
mmetsp:Transcript_28183/g.39789  ORF Transcript_28183/g.39789 Transcript_28183/m.39789 type:complete len:292 (-) Transcript_28183:29-904(-)